METKTEIQTMSYWETRKVNVGNFEGVECGLSVGVKVTEIDTLVTVSANEKCTTTEASFENDAQKLISKVKKVLDRRETELRLFAENFVADFSSIAKIPDPENRPSPTKNVRPTRGTAGRTARIKRGSSVRQAESFLDEDS